MAFPLAPATGKGGKVLISTGDGNQLSMTAMTKQATYNYKGEDYTNRIYLLGTGKTLINARPAKQPTIYIDGICSDVVIAPHASADKVTTTAFYYMYNGTRTLAAADTDISVTRPASTQGAWVAIVVEKTDGAVTAVKGTDTDGGTGIAGLSDTFGSGAGQIPLIDTTKLLIGLLKLTNGSAVVSTTEIFYDHQERSDTIATEILWNIGGVKLNAALDANHTGPVAREVKFSGYYLDNVLSEIGTAKEWSLTPSTSTVSVTTMGGSASQTVVGGWSFTFNQLATDEHVKNAMINRQAGFAVRLQYANGGYWQGVGSGAGSFKCSPSDFATIDVSGSLADDPVFV